MSRVGEKLAPYNPTSLEVVVIALDLLLVQDGDVVYDLGCGDARFLIEAYKRCATIKGIGVEYDFDIYQKAMANLDQHQLQHQLTLLHDNVLNIDFGDATVLFVYLVPEGIRKIRDQLLECLRRGARIVTYIFSIPDITPKKVEIYKGITKVYFYQGGDL